MTGRSRCWPRGGRGRGVGGEVDRVAPAPPEIVAPGQVRLARRAVDAGAVAVDGIDTARVLVGVVDGDHRGAGADVVVVRRWRESRGVADCDQREVALLR